MNLRHAIVTLLVGVSVFAGNDVLLAGIEAQGKDTLKRQLVVTDTSGRTTELSEYGIVYRPYGGNTLENAFRDGFIVEKGLGSETFRWDTIAKIEMTDSTHATLTLKSGQKSISATFRTGTLVGTSPSGGSFSLGLSKTKMIEFK